MYFFVKKQNHPFHSFLLTYLSVFISLGIYAQPNSSQKRLLFPSKNLDFQVYQQLDEDSCELKELLSQIDIYAVYFPYQKFDDGLLLEKGSFRFGRKSGEWNYYNEGILNKKSCYSNGLLDGEQLTFYESGAVASKVSHIEGIPHGVQTIFFPNGQLKQEQFYLMGRLEGEYSLYNEQGQVLVKGRFYDGKAQGFWQYFYKNGKISSEGNKVDELKEGVWKYYYENRKLKQEEDWNNGQLQSATIVLHCYSALQ